MFLSRRAILEKIQIGEMSISPFDDEKLEAASYDLSLSEDAAIPPGGFVLAKSKEILRLSPNIAALVFTTSSIARRGVDVAQSSAYCAPGTDNQVTFEIANHSSSDQMLRAGDVVAKLVFSPVT